MSKEEQLMNEEELIANSIKQYKVTTLICVFVYTCLLISGLYIAFICGRSLKIVADISVASLLVIALICVVVSTRNIRIKIREYRKIDEYTQEDIK